MDNKVITQLKDYRYLNWAKIRHSSGTVGSFLKSYEIRNNKKIYYKLSNYSFTDGIIGHEAVNEVIVDRFLNLVGLPHLEYTLHHGRIEIESKEYETYFCSSYDFKGLFDSKISLETYYLLHKQENETIIQFLSRKNLQQNIWQMLVIDYLILNRDRHGANIEILRNRSNASIRLAPAFDHGMSLLFSCHQKEEIDNFDVLQDKKVQSILGGTSTYENLKLIPKNELPKINKIGKEDKDYIFYHLENVISKPLQDKIFEMLYARSEIYENFCNQR